MRQESERRSEAVIGGLIDESPEGREEAADLGTGVMKDAGRTPALRAAHDRVMTVIARCAIEFAGDEIERALPRYRHEALASAPFTAAMIEPSFPHHRPRHPA